ncbi:MAG: hypothetical protein M3Z24_11270 [Chloroflexota bacterium]|nr:hypothetical protein [Chloroflexota bacterium]
MRIKRIIGAAVMTGMISVGVGAAYYEWAGQFSTPAAAVRATTPCQEDQPCWDWRTMGNHQRGPICRMEESATVEGYEIIVYPPTVEVNSNVTGFEIPCPPAPIQIGVA